MNANEIANPDESIFQPKGELTIYTAAETKDKLLDMIGRSKSFEIDLSQVNEFDSAGLQLLILAKLESRRHDLDVNVKRPSEAVIEVLNLCNLSSFFSDPSELSN